MHSGVGTGGDEGESSGKCPFRLYCPPLYVDWPIVPPSTSLPPPSRRRYAILYCSGLLPVSLSLSVLFTPCHHLSTFAGSPVGNSALVVMVVVILKMVVTVHRKRTVVIVWRKPVQDNCCVESASDRRGHTRSVGVKKITRPGKTNKEGYTVMYFALEVTS